MSKEQVIEREYTATLKIRMKYCMKAENEVDAGRVLDSEIKDCEEIARFLETLISLGWNEWHNLWMLKEEWGSAYPEINLVRDLHINRDSEGRGESCSTK